MINMGKIRIIFDEKACIGAAICQSLSPSYWKVEKGKTILKGSKQVSPGKWELILDDSQLKLQEMVEKSCPSRAIKVEKIGN